MIQRGMFIILLFASTSLSFFSNAQMRVLEIKKGNKLILRNEVWSDSAFVILHSTKASKFIICFEKAFPSQGTVSLYDSLSEKVNSFERLPWNYSRKGGEFYEGVVFPGRYYIKFSGDSLRKTNSGPKKIVKPVIKIVEHYDVNITRPIFELRKWLANHDFFHRYDLIGYFDNRKRNWNQDYILQKSRSVLSGHASLIGRYRGSKEIDSSAIRKVQNHLQLQTEEDQRAVYTTQSYFEGGEILDPPFLLFELKIKQGEDTLYSIARDEYKNHNVNVWDVLFKEISVTFNANFDHILVGVSCEAVNPGGSDGKLTTLIFDKGGKNSSSVTSLGFNCLDHYVSNLEPRKVFSITSAMQLIPVGCKLYSKLYPPDTVLRKREFSLGKEFFHFVDTVYFKPMIPKLLPEKIDDFYGLLTIKGLKNNIVRDSRNNWEKIDLELEIVDRREGKYLKLLPGGQYTTGGNSYPVDTQISQSLTSPELEGPLRTFANNLLTLLFAYLNR